MPDRPRCDSIDVLVERALSAAREGRPSVLLSSDTLLRGRAFSALERRADPRVAVLAGAPTNRRQVSRGCVIAVLEPTEWFSRYGFRHAWSELRGDDPAFVAIDTFAVEVLPGLEADEARAILLRDGAREEWREGIDVLVERAAGRATTLALLARDLEDAIASGASLPSDAASAEIFYRQMLVRHDAVHAHRLEASQRTPWRFVDEDVALLLRTISDGAPLGARATMARSLGLFGLDDRLIDRPFFDWLAKEYRLAPTFVTPKGFRPLSRSRQTGVSGDDDSFVWNGRVLEKVSAQGHRVWRTPLQETSSKREPRPLPLLATRDLVIAQTNATLFAVDRLGGAVRHQHRASSLPMPPTPVVIDGWLYFARDAKGGAPGSIVDCVDALSGARRAKLADASFSSRSVVRDLAAHGDNLLVSTDLGVACFSVEHREARCLWRAPLSASRYGGRLLVRSSSVLVFGDGSVVALDPATGAILSSEDDAQNEQRAAG